MTGLVRILMTAASLVASPVLAAPMAPAAACKGPDLAQVADAVGPAERFRFGRGMIDPFLALLAHRKVSMPRTMPDGADVFARAGADKSGPLVVAIRGHGCVLAVLMVPRDELYAALRRTIGPVA